MKAILKPRSVAPERIDGRQKVLGAVRFTMDFSLPGMTHAKVLRSPVPHAQIKSIDTSRARSLRGVLAVVTGADIATMPDPFYGVGIRDQPVLAIDKVRYVGDMVAAVVAEDEATAFRALELIDVEYVELPALIDDRRRAGGRGSRNLRSAFVRRAAAGRGRRAKPQGAGEERTL